MCRPGPRPWDGEVIVIVPSAWAWAHFELEVAPHVGGWWVRGGWNLTLIGQVNPWDGRFVYGNRMAALRNYSLLLRDQMMAAAGRHSQPSQFRQAESIAARVTDWWKALVPRGEEEAALFVQMELKL